MFKYYLYVSIVSGSPFVVSFLIFLWSSYLLLTSGMSCLATLFFDSTPMLYFNVVASISFSSVINFSVTGSNIAHLSANSHPFFYWYLYFPITHFLVQSHSFFAQTCIFLYVQINCRILHLFCPNLHPFPTLQSQIKQY